MANHDRTIHIWVISKFYLPHLSGAAIQAHQVFKKLIHKEISITVLTTGRNATAALRGQLTRRDGIEIRYLSTPRHKNWSSIAEARMLNKINLYLGWLLGEFSFGIQTAWTLWREGRPDDIVRVYAPSQFSFLPVWVAKLKGMHPMVHMTLLNSDDPESIKKHWNKISGILGLESFKRVEAITGYSSAQIQTQILAPLKIEILL